jgi:hypothetical protein
MADSNIMAMVGAFIAVSIMLGIGVQILGNSVQDCTNLPDFNATAGATQTGWAAQCETTNTQSQSAYSLLIIVIIVIAAVVILAVVRMLA